jgi:hypothetical protein
VTAPLPGDGGVDPVLLRRARYERLAGLGQRAGYLLLTVAVVAFVAGFAMGFPAAAVAITIAGLVGACVLLPPAIIAGFAVKAADREDRRAGRGAGGKSPPGPGDTMP